MPSRDEQITHRHPNGASSPLDRPRARPMIAGGNEAVWARHAHPLSIWSRILLGLPLLILAGWSRVWIGPWWLLVLAAAIAFLWINPRLTPPPRSLDNWGARATLGERIWLRTRRRDLPRQHRVMPRLLAVASALGHLVLLFGVVALDPWLTLLGYLSGMVFKLWFLDRMVWLEWETGCV